MISDWIARLPHFHGFDEALNSPIPRERLIDCSEFEDGPLILGSGNEIQSLQGQWIVCRGGVLAQEQEGDQCIHPVFRSGINGNPKPFPIAAGLSPEEEIAGLSRKKTILWRTASSVRPNGTINVWNRWTRPARWLTEQLEHWQELGRPLQIDFSLQQGLELEAPIWIDPDLASKIADDIVCHLLDICAPKSKITVAIGHHADTADWIVVRIQARSTSSIGVHAGESFSFHHRHPDSVAKNYQMCHVKDLQYAHQLGRLIDAKVQRTSEGHDHAFELSFPAGGLLAWLRRLRGNMRPSLHSSILPGQTSMGNRSRAEIETHGESRGREQLPSMEMQDWNLFQLWFPLLDLSASPIEAQVLDQAIQAAIDPEQRVIQMESGEYLVAAQSALLDTMEISHQLANELQSIESSIEMEHVPTVFVSPIGTLLDVLTQVESGVARLGTTPSIDPIAAKPARTIDRSPKTDPPIASKRKLDDDARIRRIHSAHQPPNAPKASFRSLHKFWRTASDRERRSAMTERG